ncbi:MAG: HNH endonuclease [Candidatus Krumholzibacteriota bacterium]|nr:HNH endonuclease [Candidatus Krumholzibacteriota bacterium]
MTERLDDKRVRAAVFQWLRDQARTHDEILPRSLLAQGFEFDGNRIPVVGPQGIFKPRVLEVPLSITTTVHGPYDDRLGNGGLILYRYRGSDPRHRDNVGLRTAMARNIPLVYFHAVSPGKYMAVWPVFIVGDNPAALTFQVAVDDAAHAGIFKRSRSEAMVAEDMGRRQYITSTVKQRLHQRGFRERVLTAYRQQCALCRLRHAELLDAAHIIPDGEPGGEPVVVNGIALCKLHHAAYDKFFLGIDPDYFIRVRRDILEEEDGPMLLHGLKGMDGNRIILPRAVDRRPSRERLEMRFGRFREAERRVI